jgi:hypothetical protein
MWLATHLILDILYCPLSDNSPAHLQRGHFPGPTTNFLTLLFKAIFLLPPDSNNSPNVISEGLLHIPFLSTQIRFVVKEEQVKGVGDVALQSCLH